MNPSKIGRGKSFKGVVAYLMQGERDAVNPEHAQWTATQNIGTENLYMAARVMAASAMDADQLKRANGWDGRGRGSTAQPVLHLSKSWHEDYHPDAAHQEQAAREMLKAIGLDQALAVMVGHNDNEKTHLHIVVNVLDPQTGKQFDLGNDQKKMQAFALEYCRAHDMEHLAPNRAKNAEIRQQIKETRDTGLARDMEGRKRLSRDEWRQMRRDLLDRQKLERGALKQQHRQEWAEVRKAIDERQKIERAEWRAEHQRQKEAARAEFKGDWRDLFQQQRAQAEESAHRIELAARAYASSKTIMGRTMGAIGITKNAFEAEAGLTMAKMDHAALLDRQERQRLEAAKVQGQLVSQRTREAIARGPARERIDTGAIKAGQDHEWQNLRNRQQGDRDAAGIKTGGQARPAQEQNRQAQERQAEQKQAERAKEQSRVKEARRKRDRSLTPEDERKYQKWRDKERRNRAQRDNYRGRER